MKEKLISLVKSFKNEVDVYRSVIADPRCPRLARWMLVFTVAYALSPIDIIPDFIPVIGYLDDLILLPLLIWIAISIIPKDLIFEYKNKQ